MDLFGKDEIARTLRQAQITLASVQEVVATNAPKIEALVSDASALVADLREIVARLKGA